MTINELTGLIMAQAKEKGFGTTPEEINIAEKMVLIHSEISEAYEGYRHQNINGPGGLHEELGDAMQRILHLCGVLGIDIEQAILKKIESNKTRTWDWEHMNGFRADKKQVPPAV